MVRKRIRVSDKRQAVKRLASESLEQVAAAYGVTTMTVRNWIDTYSPPASASPPASTVPLLGRVETVPLPPETERPQEDNAAGGYDAARAAAGLGPPPADAPPPPPPEEPKPEVPKIDPAQGLIFMSKIGLQVSVRFYAARLKIKLTDEVKRLAEVTPEEEKQLETYAPFAAPYISEMLTKYGPIIGAGIYGFIYFTMLTDRFGTLKEMAPAKKDVPDLQGDVK